MNTRRQFLQFAGGGFAAAWATSSRLVIGADEVPAGAVTFRMMPDNPFINHMLNI